MLASMELVFLVCKPMTLALPHRRCHLSPCRTAFRPADSQPRAVTMCFALQRPRVLLPNPAIVVMPLHKPISQAALPRCAWYLIGRERADRTVYAPVSSGVQPKPPLFKLCLPGWCGATASSATAPQHVPDHCICPRAALWRRSNI